MFPLPFCRSEFFSLGSAISNRGSIYIAAAGFGERGDGAAAAAAEFAGKLRVSGVRGAISLAGSEAASVPEAVWEAAGQLTRLDLSGSKVSNLPAHQLARCTALQVGF